MTNKEWKRAIWEAIYYGDAHYKVDADVIVLNVKVLKKVVRADIKIRYHDDEEHVRRNNCEFDKESTLEFYKRKVG